MHPSMHLPYNSPRSRILTAILTAHGRYDKTRWEAWNTNLGLIAAKPGNIIASNNEYDAEYIKYFTRIGDNTHTYI